MPIFLAVSACRLQVCLVPVTFPHCLQVNIVPGQVHDILALLQGTAAAEGMTMRCCTCLELPACARPQT